MNPTVKLIDDLQVLLRTDATPATTEAWWLGVQSIESSFSTDQRQTVRGRELIRHLRSSMTSAITAIKERQPYVPISSVSITLEALKSEMEDVSIGIDGWPIGR